MRSFASPCLRTVVLLGHSGSGKTTLADALVYLAGHSNRFGRTGEGSSLFDYEPDEIERQGSVNASVGFAEWNNHKIQFIDTPGFADFWGQVESAVRVADAALLVISGVDGVEVQTEKGWEAARARQLPTLALVNRMDTDRARFDSVIRKMSSQLGINAVPLQIPIGEGQSFSGVIDVLSGKAYAEESPGQVKEIPLPDDLAPAVEAAREKLVEAAAEGSDELTEKYLEELTLGEEDVRLGLSAAVRAGKAVPVLCSSADRLIGITPLANAIISLLPTIADNVCVRDTRSGATDEITIECKETAPLSALVFRTVVDQYGRVSFLRVYSGTLQADSQVYNSGAGQRERLGGLFLIQGKDHIPVPRAVPGEIVGSVKMDSTNTGHTLCSDHHQIALDPPIFPPAVAWLAVHPKSRADEDKLAIGLRRLVEEDGSLHWYRETETNETILAGLGDVHLQTGIERLKRKFGVEVTITIPKIPYKETVRKRAEAEGRHKKQTGGAGQFGVATVEVAPLPRGSGFEFQDAVVGGVIPNTYIPSVEKGVRERLGRGFIAGYPMVDVHVKLFDGKTHPVDSNAISFQLAGRLAVEMAVPRADPYLLEPIMNIEVVIPEENMGDIIGDLNSKRGRIMGMESRGHYQVIRAQAPMRDLSRYSADLRSITRGRGAFSLSLSHYEEVPAHLAQQIVAEAREDKEKKDEER